MITYGGDPTTQGMIALAKQRRIPVVFMLHNFAYTTPRAFANVDYCIVASEFARRHYRERVGLDCQAIPYAIDWKRVRVESRNPRFVTFVNPCLEKGVYAFARIAHELGRRRSDIPLLVVESRGTRDTLAACGIDVHRNIEFMPHTTDCRRFWAVTKFVLMPSLWWENQPLVAIEAMLSGIPVIGSDRGGIPETLGQAGFTLPLPARLTPVSKILPTAEEVEPWVETIIRLWDDQDLYREQCEKAKNEAQRWHPDRVRPLYAKFFSDVRQQPGPPILWREIGPPARTTPGAPASCFQTTRQNVGANIVPMANGAIREPLQLPATGAAASIRTAPAKPAISFVLCVSDDAIAQANLMASPCLGPESAHEIIVIKNSPSAAAALNLGLDRAKCQWVVCPHQDVRLPSGWDHEFLDQLRIADERLGPIGVAGVYGVGAVVGGGEAGPPLAAERIGWVVDRGRVLRDGPALPAPVATLDELLLVVRRDSGLRFDPALGFHLYGADLCLQARDRGLAVVALAAPCHHNSRSVGLPQSFHASAKIFARKWAHRLPVATPCVIIGRDGSVHLLGNAGEDSIAYAGMGRA
jgi:hypothetical protein